MTFKSRQGEIINIEVPVSEIRASSDGEGIVEAYVSIFNVKDSYGSIFKPGCFRDSLDKGVNRLKVLWNHDSRDLPIGKVLEAREDAIGLYAKYQLILSIQRAADVFQLIKEGVVDTMSFGFRILEDGVEDGVWVIRKVELMEISPVNFASQDMAMILDARSEDIEPSDEESLEPTVEEIQEILRESRENFEIRNILTNIRSSLK